MGLIIYILLFSADIKSRPPRFSRYLADDGELRSVDVVAVNPKWEHRSQRHHAAHRRHVVQVRLRVLDVAGAVTGRQETHATSMIYHWKGTLGGSVRM